MREIGSALVVFTETGRCLADPCGTPYRRRGTAREGRQVKSHAVALRAFNNCCMQAICSRAAAVTGDRGAGDAVVFAALGTG